MTLHEMSYIYREDALRFRMRITLLRERSRSAPKEEARRLRRRILELETLARQSRELAELTQRYYERSYHRNEKYSL